MIAKQKLKNNFHNILSAQLQTIADFRLCLINGASDPIPSKINKTTIIGHAWRRWLPTASKQASFQGRSRVSTDHCGDNYPRGPPAAVVESLVLILVVMSYRLLERHSCFVLFRGKKQLKVFCVFGAFKMSCVK